MTNHIHYSSFLSRAEEVFQKTKERVRAAILQLIEREREAFSIDRSLLKNVLGIFIEVGLNGDTDYYSEDFERFLLSETSAHYTKKASIWVQVSKLVILNTAGYKYCAVWDRVVYCVTIETTWSASCMRPVPQLAWPYLLSNAMQSLENVSLRYSRFLICLSLETFCEGWLGTIWKSWIEGMCGAVKYWSWQYLHLQEDSCPEYMSKAEDALKQEEERVNNYLRQESKKGLLKAVEEEILAKYETQVLEKENSGCAALLRDNKVVLCMNATHCCLSITFKKLK